MEFPIYKHARISNAAIVYPGFGIYNNEIKEFGYPIIIIYEDGKKSYTFIGHSIIHLYKTDIIVKNIDIYEAVDIWGDYLIYAKKPIHPAIRDYYKKMVDIIL